MSNISNIIESAVLLRREIHANPEPKFDVAATVDRIRKFLIEVAGVNEDQMTPCAENGLIVDLVGKAPPVTNNNGDAEDFFVHNIALRADTDALPMTEKNHQLPYRSLNEGVAHMCGHDGHIACLLSGAALINARMSRLPSNYKVRLLLQPAEETPGGALPMMQAGCLEGIDEVYGMHNWPTSPVGCMRVKPGPLMAHVCEFSIEIKGKGTHASQPQTGIDPIVAGAALVTALQTIISRNVHYQESAVLSVTQFHGGEVNNVIPDSCVLQGTIRDFNADVFKLISQRMVEITESTCKAYGATGEVTFMDFYPVLNNHAKQTEEVEQVAKQVLAAFKSINNLDAAYTKDNEILVNADALPMTGAEDFAYYLMEKEFNGKPGCFFFLGGYEEHLTSLSAAGVENHEIFKIESKKMLEQEIASTILKDDKLNTPGAFASDEANKARRTNCICHGTAFDFNDNVIPNAMILWLKIVEKRLGISLYEEEEVSPEVFAGAIKTAVGNLNKVGPTIQYGSSSATKRQKTK